jgi:WD40 repeat protein
VTQFPELAKQNTLGLDWHPTEEGTIATVLETGLLVWDLNEGTEKIKQSLTNLPFGTKLDNGKWNPHLYGNQFTFMYGSSISGIDLRTNEQAWTLPKAHNFQVRDVDFNPNRQYYFATCGDDCLTKFWDFRNCKEHLKKLECHSHWVWRVRYNPSHDQLVLTSGSDSTVVLHSLPSISS